MRITRTITLDDSEIHLTHVRASGPGGQNVNKVASAVVLRFDVAGSRSLTDTVRHRLIRLAGNRVTDRGVLIIKAQRYRTQERNRRDALERLAQWIRRAATLPKPRRATRPTAASKRKRLDAKQRRGQAKRLRGAVDKDAD
jgi:ribosome-associated protein